MKTTKLLGLFLSLCLSVSAFAQLPDGSLAPDFTVTDTDGTEHHLQSYLDQGYHVMLCFDATWAAPSWNYLTVNGAMNEVYASYGPEGTDEYIVLLIEGDAQTSLDDLMGIGDQSQGNWLEEADFPVVHIDGESVAQTYNIAYYPTVYGICPDGILREVGQVEAPEVVASQGEYCCPSGYENDIRLIGDIIYETSCETGGLYVELQNSGFEDVSSCTIALSHNGELLSNVEWNGLLSSCETESVYLGEYTFTSGVIEAEITTEDDYMNNNLKELNIENGIATGNSHLKIELLTDSYPDETTWELLDENGNIVASSPNGGYSTPEVLYEYEFYLDALGCYELFLYDEYGDGLSSSQWGGEDGSFHAYFVNDDGTDGDIIINYNGDYDFAQLHHFISVTEIAPFNVTGTVFNDENENGVMDEGEVGIPGVLVVLDGVSTYTNEDGIYIFEDVEDPQSLLVHINPEVWPTSTTNTEFDLSETADYSNDVGVSSNDPNYGADINYAQSGIYLCETETVLHLSVTNTGNTVADIELTFLLDDLFEIISTEPEASQLVGQSIKWNTDDLPAGATYYYHVNVLAPDWQSMGELLSNTVVLNVFDDDGNIQDTDTQVEEDILLCSYDPNDKQVFPEGVTENHYVHSETRLEYFIRFQNTGNYYATDITVSDPISEDLDLETFELVGTSHNCIPTIDFNTRVIDFHFPEIYLPDSTTNEPGSHGHITFRIDHVTDIPQPTTIENTAYIYFDSNPAVVTNTTWTTIDDAALGIEEVEANQLLLSPNPAQNQVRIGNTTHNDRANVLVRDMTGKVVMQLPQHSLNQLVDISSLSSGIYLIELRNDDDRPMGSGRFIKE